MTSALDQKGLEPCPFCGGEAELRSNAAKGRAWVSCTRCMAESGGFEIDDWSMDRLRDAAAQEWNRRSTVTPAEIAGVVKRLEKRADQAGMLLSDPPKPHPDNKLLRKAATLIERLAASQAETRRSALEEAAKMIEGGIYSTRKEMLTGLDIASAILALIDQPSTEGGKDHG